MGFRPNTSIDESARAITTSFLLKKLLDIYNIKLSIGIATESCFTGLINIQGNRKLYSILGYKAMISRLLADKANRRNIRNNFDLSMDKEFILINLLFIAIKMQLNLVKNGIDIII